jgi:hypothetical protein
MAALIQGKQMNEDEAHKLTKLNSNPTVAHPNATVSPERRRSQACV